MLRCCPVSCYPFQGAGPFGPEAGAGAQTPASY